MELEKLLAYPSDVNNPVSASVPGIPHYCANIMFALKDWNYNHHCGKIPLILVAAFGYYRVKNSNWQGEQSRMLLTAVCTLSWSLTDSRLLSKATGSLLHRFTAPEKLSLGVDGRARRTCTSASALNHPALSAPASCTISWAGPPTPTFMAPEKCRLTCEGQQMI